MLDKFRLSGIYLYFQKLPAFFRYLFLVFFLAFTVVSIIRALGKGEVSDFHVFWLAGKNFYQFNELYLLEDQVRQFLYPPFAAAVFGVLALFPFKIAAILFSILNMALWLVCLLLCKHIIEYLAQVELSPLVVLLSLFFSLEIYINNLNLLQVNLLLFCLVLLFIYHYLRQNYLLAAVFIAAAICIKVTPVVFLGWLFFRGKVFRCFLYSLLALLMFTALPIFIRGIELGVYDLQQFMKTISQEIPQMNLESESYTHNRSLRGMLSNYLIQISFLSDQVKESIISLSSFALGLLYLGWLVILRIRRIKISAFEFAGTFIAILLCSAVTGTAHMVTLLFPFLALLSAAFASGSRRNVFYVLFLCSMFILPVGNAFDHLLLERINVFGIAMILGLIASVVLSFKEIAAPRGQLNA